MDEYYTALGQIARLAYRGNHIDALNFFELYLWRAHLPSEMPAVARAIQRFPRSQNEAAYLEDRLHRDSRPRNDRATTADRWVDFHPRVHAPIVQTNQ